MRKIQQTDELPFSTLGKVLDRLYEQGLRAPAKPEGEMPGPATDLEKLDGSAIITEFKRIEAWHEHVSYRAVLAAAVVGEWKNNLKLITAEAKKGRSDVDLDFDDAVSEARKQLQIAEQEAAVLDAHKSILYRRLANVSRIIEMRKIDWAGTSRGENAGYHRGGYR